MLNDWLSKSLVLVALGAALGSGAASGQSRPATNVGAAAAAQASKKTDSPATPAARDADSAEKPILLRLESYLTAFNRHDAAAVGAYWSPDGVSLAEDSGERLSGREALVRHFTAFFEDAPTARLSGEIAAVKLIRPDVALVDGRTTLFVADAEPVVSTYSAILVKEGDEWFISNSRERDAPLQGSRAALRELEWLVGAWQDQSEELQVRTTVRWSPNEAFLIRSFTVQDPNAEPLEGTQVIGWDPLNRQIRTWTFQSDGSFGQGTVSKHEGDWLLKFWQILPDGRLAAATQVITRVDQDTMTVQVIGESVDGEPAPSSAVVTVVRVPETAEVPADGPAGERGKQP